MNSFSVHENGDPKPFIPGHGLPLQPGMRVLPMSAIKSMKFTVDEGDMGPLSDIGIKIVIELGIEEMEDGHLLCEVYVPRELFPGATVVQLLTNVEMMKTIMDQIELDMHDLEPEWFKKGK